MSIPSVSFLCFAPEEKAKGMSTLSSVIELKDKNRAAAEASRGFEVAEEERYATKFKPITDAISSASGEIIRYSSEKDVKYAAKEVIDASTQHRVAFAQANADPTDQGLAGLVVAYAAQKIFAEAKMNYLIAAEDYAKATPAQRVVALGALETARDVYADALSAFQGTPIPVGFKQTVSIQQPPPKGSVYPGANLEISPTPTLPAQAGPRLVAKQPPPGPSAPPPAPDLVADPKGGPPSPTPTLRKKQPATPKGTTMPKRPAVPPEAFLSSSDLSEDLVNFAEGKEASPGPVRTTKGNGAMWIDLNTGELNFTRVNGSETYSGMVKARPKTPNIYHVAFHDEKGVKKADIILNKVSDRFLEKGSIFSTLPENLLSAAITMYVSVFGGWGKAFEGEKFFDPTNPKHSAIAMDISQHPEYANVIASLKGEHKTIGEGMKFETKATPKASVMRLSPEGYYGNLVIDVPALYNDGRLIARERGDQYGSNLSGGGGGKSCTGKIVLDMPMAPGLKNLIIKRAMQTTINKASPETQKQLRKLRKLAGFIPSKPKVSKPSKATTGGRKMKPPTQEERDSGVIVIGDPKELMDRLRVAMGVYDAGNRSKKSAQLISELATAVYQQGHITTDKFERILTTYKPE